ncbi:MAG: indole-3-glycerol phosphate synthase [Acidimicrobiaceae bacterium]|nr:indole-3-glycerol phosphate synthase [Acidimicrobiaceae bacterium]
MSVGNGTYLDRIIAEHRVRALADQRSVEQLFAEAVLLPETRGFRSSLSQPALSVIAEIKRRSPSKGDLFVDLNPAVLAREYATGGAACISVLTDEANFGGSQTDLEMARDAVKLPVLRKDFTVDERDVLDARLMGADAVLLIVAALSKQELERFFSLSGELGLDALVETHDEAELETALEIGAELIGVNQRNLITFEVDHERAARMAELIPDDVIAVAESGVRGPADAATLRQAGYAAILVGETLVTSGDATAAVAALREAV